MNKKAELEKYLKAHRLLTLATVSDKPWICTVYYVLDEQLNFYFLSDRDSRHVREILKNNQVAISVADSDQGFLDPKVGIQLEGIASEITGIAKLKWFFKMWNTLFPGKENKFNLENLSKGKKGLDSKIIKVKPVYIKYMNKDLFGEETYGFYYEKDLL